MKTRIERDNKRRKLVKKYEEKRRQLKAEVIKRENTLEDQYIAIIKLARLPRNSSITRIRNRCTETGRSRGVYRKFKCSRIRLRERASMGELAGVTISSW